MICPKCTQYTHWRYKRCPICGQRLENPLKVIRDFECRECGLVFAKLTKELEKEHCPRCNGVDTKSIFAPLAFKITGQGAYSNKMKV